MKAIILAGGLGTRLRSEVSELPKVMANVGNRPFLEHLLDQLIQSGVKSFVFSVGYLGEIIQDHFGNEYQNCPIDYAIEEERLGTGGAILNALQFVSEENVVVVNGDSMVQTNLREQFNSHVQKNADVTLVLKKLFDFNRYGTVEINASNRILAFREKTEMKEGLINAGVYIFKTAKLKSINFPKVFSIEKEFFEKEVNNMYFNGEITDGYFLDIGIPEDFKKAQFEIGVLPKIDKTWCLIKDFDKVQLEELDFSELNGVFSEKETENQMYLSHKDNYFFLRIKSPNFPTFFDENEYSFQVLNTITSFL